MAALPALARLKSKKYRKRSKSLVSYIEAMIAIVNSAPLSRHWTADLRSEYRSKLKFALRRARHIERLNARRAGIVKGIQTQRAMGLRLAQTRDLNAQLDWLLNRQAHRSRGLYAMAQGKRTARKLGLGHYSDIGKLGAMRRWHPEQVEQLVMWSVGTVFPE